MGKWSGILQGLGTLMSGLEKLGEYIGTDDEARLRGATPLDPAGRPRERPPILTLFEQDDIDSRLREIVKLIQAGRTDPAVIEWANTVVSQQCGTDEDGTTEWCVAEKDHEGEAKAMFLAHRNRVRYVYDPRSVDLYKGARRTLKWRAGDCDCQVVSLGSALEAIGHRVALAVAEVEGGEPGWNHIWLVDLLPPQKPERALHMDPTVNRECGWHVPRKMVKRFKTIRVPA